MITVTTTFIEYDTDGNEALAADLELPQNLVFEFDNIKDVECYLTDKISDKTGFCVLDCGYIIGNPLGLET